MECYATATQWEKEATIAKIVEFGKKWAPNVKMIALSNKKNRLKKYWKMSFLYSFFCSNF